MISKVRMSKWSISHRRKAPEAQRDLFCILQICQVPLQKAAFYLLNIKTITAQLHRKFSFWISFSNPSLEPYYFSSASITPSKFHHYKMYYHSENALGGIFIPCYGIMYSDVFKSRKLLCSQSGRHNLNINQPWCKLWVTLKFVNTFHNGTVLNPASSGSDFYYCTTRWVIIIASLLLWQAHPCTVVEDLRQRKNTMASNLEGEFVLMKGWTPGAGTWLQSMSSSGSDTFPHSSKMQCPLSINGKAWFCLAGCVHYTIKQCTQGCLTVPGRGPLDP